MAHSDLRYCFALNPYTSVPGARRAYQLIQYFGDVRAYLSPIDAILPLSHVIGLRILTQNESAYPEFMRQISDSALLLIL